MRGVFLRAIMLWPPPHPWDPPLDNNFEFTEFSAELWDPKFKFTEFSEELSDSYSDLQLCHQWLTRSVRKGWCYRQRICDGGASKCTWCKDDSWDDFLLFRTKSSINRSSCRQNHSCPSCRKTQTTHSTCTAASRPSSLASLDYLPDKSRWIQEFPICTWAWFHSKMWLESCEIIKPTKICRLWLSPCLGDILRPRKS